MSLVRDSHPGDAVALHALWKICIEEFHGRRGGDELVASWPVTAQEDPYADFMSQPADTRSRVWVGEHHDLIVGSSAAWITEEVGHLAIYVGAEHRRFGQGPKLLEKALEWFALEKISTIDAIALPGDRDLKSLFEKSDFKARLLIMRASLNPGEA